MEKLKTYVMDHLSEVIFITLNVILLGFFALPFLNVELLTGFGSDEEAVFGTFSLSIYQLIGGGKFGEATLIPDVIFILTLLLILTSLTLVIVGLFLKNKKVVSILNGSSLVTVLVTAIILGVSENFLPSYDYLRGWMEPYVTLIDGAKFNLLGFSLNLIVLILMFISLGLSAFRNVKFSVPEIVEMSMLIALALVLDKLKVPLGATGGSINFAGLPLLLLSLRYGPLKGFIGSSIVFGLISCLIDGYGFQTFPFDYFIAFSGYLFAGLAYNIFKATLLKDNTSKNKELGYMIVSLSIGCVAVFVTRMIGSGISSYVYFLSYIGDMVTEYGSKFMAVFMYNIVYIGPSALGSLVLAILLAKPMQIVNHRFPVRSIEEEQPTETAE